MATLARSRLTRITARRFGIELGVAACGVGALLVYRGMHPRLAAIALAVGVLLVTAALVHPSALAPVARRWMALAAQIARFTSPILLSVVYFVVLTPTGWIRRTFGHSPIARDTDATTYWVRRDPTSAAERRAAMERRF